MNEEKLKELLTTEFIVTLTEVAKLYGWSGDFIEIARFVEECYRIVGMPVPDIQAYEEEE